MGVPNFRFFSPLRMRADLNNFWWTWEPRRRTFKKMETFFFWQKKIPNSQPKFSVCEFGIFFCKKKRSQFFESSPCWLPGPPKIIQIGPHPEWRKNIRFLAWFCLYASLDKSRRQNQGGVAGRPRRGARKARPTLRSVEEKSQTGHMSHR